MNKTAIKNFAIWARRKLISEVTYKAGLIGVTEAGAKSPLPQSARDVQFFDIGTSEYAKVSGAEIKQRNALIEAVKKNGFQNVVEEIAYTWFNRLIAVRFMEVNDYLPSHVRVLSSENPLKAEPDLVTSPFDTDLEFTEYERILVLKLKDENKLDELFRFLFIKQCNKLNEILPNLFEKTEDYTELLLPISFTDKEGVVSHLVNDISEDDFNVSKEGQVEIIGWMYQYYISEKHDEIINIYKGTVKKEDIPAATQLFTPDWIVKYMVDNSLGRYWIERHPESMLEDVLEFFVRPKDGTNDYVNEILSPKEMTFFDPCMGSGHILVYAFDVLMSIYRECGYTDRDAAVAIINNNLYGLDIDKRAYQLAYFAVMMKGRQYNRRIFKEDVHPNLYSIEESNDIKVSLKRLKEVAPIAEKVLEDLKDAKTYGSIIQPKATLEEISLLKEKLNEINTSIFYSFIDETESNELVSALMPLVYVDEILSKKYSAVVTNPPYLNKYNDKLKTYIKKYYKDYSGDLYSVFMYRNFKYCSSNGYTGFMTPFVWMFIQTYEKLRDYLIKNKSYVTLIQMEYSAFSEATVPICSFILGNKKADSNGYYFRLTDFPGGMEVQRKKVLEALKNKDCGFYYETSQYEFDKVIGSPISYWASKKTLKAYENQTVDKQMECKSGIMTGSDKYICLWFEANTKKIKLDCKSYRDMGEYKWFPLNSGGDFRKWYGNNIKLVNLWHGGIEIKEGVKNYRLRDADYYFKNGITWGRITSSQICFREIYEGSLFGDAGPVGFVDKNRKYILGFLNSKVVKVLLQITNPTLNFQIHDIINLPLCVDSKANNQITDLVIHNIDVSKLNWDSFETSWDFKKHPLI